MQYGNQPFVSIAIAIAITVYIFFLFIIRRQKKLISRFADKELLASIAPSASPRRKLVKMFLITAALFLALFSLARPQWGFEWQEIKRSGLDMLITMDVSKSMLATDVKPNRLERSKFAVKDLIKKLNGDRIGLIAFAGTAFLQCPLTIDYNGFLLAMDDLNVGTIPRGGTSIESAIKETINIYKGPDAKYKIMIIITDGEELEGDSLRAAKEAAAAGIKIYCVGVGSSEGELVPGVDERGGRGFLRDSSGNVVKTRLNEDALKAIAIATGGSYIRATQAEFGLTLLYDKSISRLEKRDMDAKMTKHYQERFQYFLGFSILLLLIESFVSERKKAP